MHAADLFAPREITPQAVLDVLSGCVGEAHGINAADLASTITRRRAAADLRRLRSVIEALRSQGHRICGHPAHGYWLAANDDELNQSCAFLFERAMTSLRQIGAMKRVALPDLAGQLGLPLRSTKP